jgi:elongation factor Ts
MAISASDVMKLRDQTGAGMMDCKKALEATSGDFEAAVDHLRKQGLKSADKMAGRATGEGRVYVTLAPDGRSGAIVAVECETDFVARTSDFESLLADLCAHVLEHRPGSAEEMLEQPWSKGGGTVSEAVRVAVGKLGENLRLAGARFLENPGGRVGSYVHHNQKIGVLASVDTSRSSEEASELLKELCMHIAVNNPIGRVREDVDQALLAREREIYREEAKDKPADMQEKIVEGKVRRFYAEKVLVEQPWVKDDKLSVAQAVQARLGKDAAVAAFARFAIGA